MSAHHIHAIQLLVRVSFTDGTMVGILMPSAELNPLDVDPEETQAIKLMDTQVELIRDQIHTLGRDGLHAAAIQLAHHRAGLERVVLEDPDEKEQKMKSRADVIRKLGQLVSANVASTEPGCFVSAQAGDESLRVTTCDNHGVQRRFEITVNEVTDPVPSPAPVPVKEEPATPTEEPTKEPAEEPADASAKREAVGV